MVTKINPVFDAAQARSFLTKSISVFTVDPIVDVTASTAPFEAIDAMIKTISLRATIVAHSAITVDGFTVWVEGEFPTDDYNTDGSATTFAAQLQADLRALGTIDALDLSGTTVAAGGVFKADQV